MITVTVKFTGMLKMNTGEDETVVQLQPEATVADMIDALVEQFGPDMERQVHQGYHVMLERPDGSTQSGDTRSTMGWKLADGDSVMFLYTFAGGQ